MEGIVWNLLWSEIPRPIIRPISRNAFGRQASPLISIPRKVPKLSGTCTTDPLSFPAKPLETTGLSTVERLARGGGRSDQSEGNIWRTCPVLQAHRYRSTDRIHRSDGDAANGPQSVGA